MKTIIKKSELKKLERGDFHPVAKTIRLDEKGQPCQRVLVHPAIGVIEKGEVLHRFTTLTSETFFHRSDLDPLDQHVPSALGKEHEWEPMLPESMAFIQVKSVYAVTCPIDAEPGWYASSDWAYQAGDAEGRMAVIIVRPDHSAVLLAGTFLPSDLCSRDDTVFDDEAEIDDSDFDTDLDEVY